MIRAARVCQVLEATAGGTRRHLAEAVAALSSDEFELHLIVAADRDPSFRKDIQAYRERGHRVSILPMTSGVDPIADWRANRGLRRLLRQHPCDILHLHSAKAGWIGRLDPRGLDCCTLYSPHGFPFIRKGSAWELASYRMAERFCALRTQTLLAVSEAEAELALRSGLFAPDRVELLPNALDLGAFERRIAGQGPLHRVGEEMHFGLAGELRAQKDPFTLLNAAVLLKNRGTKFSLLLPRRGALLAESRSFVERNRLTSNVKFVATEHNLDEVFRRSDVIVLPSRWEGLPYSMLEALALRLPLIASDLPVFRDMLEPIEPLQLFPAGDAAALADRMDYFARLSPTERRAIGEKGWQRVATEHCAESWGRRFREIVVKAFEARQK